MMIISLSSSRRSDALGGKDVKGVVINPASFETFRMLGKALRV
jgi:hypothetical protein